MEGTIFNGRTTLMNCSGVKIPDACHHCCGDEQQHVNGNEKQGYLMVRIAFLGGLLVKMLTVGLPESFASYNSFEERKGCVEPE